MELDAFRSRIGISQGRLCEEPGKCAFVLGDMLPGHIHDLSTGDFAEVIQDADVSDIDLIRAEMTIDIPEGLPESQAWEVSLVVDGFVLARITCLSGETKCITDLAANVSKLTGVHTVGVRLKLVNV